MYITYVLYSAKINKYYTGHTSDFTLRLVEHNRGKTPFMNNGKPWIVVFTREHNSRAEATKLEMFIKKKGAKRFLNDINSKLS